MYTRSARTGRTARARRVRRRLEDAGGACSRLPEREELPRRGVRRARRRHFAGGHRLLARPGRRPDRRPGQPGRTPPVAGRAQVDRGLSTL